MGVLPWLTRNELVGLAVDVDRLRALTATFEREYADARAALNLAALRDVNPHAAADIGLTIFDDWGVSPTPYTRTGLLTTQDKYLKARTGEHPGIALVLRCRQLLKYLSTYTRKLPGLLRDGRYHPDWKYTRTISGRMAETIILLIPKHDPLAKPEGRMNRAYAIRDCFHATEGHTLVSADLSQIEMRVMAHESRDPLFLRNFATGVDMHASTAHHLLGAPARKEDQDPSKHRLPAKTLNFGILMGLTEYGLLDQLHENGQPQWIVDWPDDDGDGELELALREQGFQSTREFRDEWFKLYPGVADWIAARKAQAHATGYVRDLWGRRIDVSGVWSSNDRIVAEFERKAHAVPIQSGAIGIAKRWNARIYRHVIAPRIAATHRRRYCEPWNWEHDALTLEVDDRIPRTVTHEILRLVPQDLCVPVMADASRGVRWGSLE